MLLPQQNIKINSTFIILVTKSSHSIPLPSQKLNCLSTEDVHRAKFLSSNTSGQCYYHDTIQQAFNNNDEELHLTIKEHLFTFAGQTMM